MNVLVAGDFCFLCNGHYGMQLAQLHPRHLQEYRRRSRNLKMPRYEEFIIIVCGYTKNCIKSFIANNFALLFQSQFLIEFFLVRLFKRAIANIYLKEKTIQRFKIKSINEICI